MKKAYTTHERAYRKLEARGQGSWNEQCVVRGREARSPVDREIRHFLADVLRQPWSPRRGRAIELGCGTGPILRWLHGKGFTGMGIDVSRTAIAMAREQSRGLDLRFVQGDVCARRCRRHGVFDLVVDGHCLHCVLAPRDRKAFLENARSLLRPGGVLIVLCMCAPVDRRTLARVIPGQKLVGRLLYVPWEGAHAYEQSRLLGNTWHLPTRHVAAWSSILKEVEAAGFSVQRCLHDRPWGDDPFGTLCLAATPDPSFTVSRTTVAVASQIAREAPQTQRRRRSGTAAPAPAR